MSNLVTTWEIYGNSISYNNGVKNKLKIADFI